MAKLSRRRLPAAIWKAKRARLMVTESACVAMMWSGAQSIIPPNTHTHPHRHPYTCAHQNTLELLSNTHSLRHVHTSASTCTESSLSEVMNLRHLKTALISFFHMFLQVVYRGWNKLNKWCTLLSICFCNCCVTPFSVIYYFHYNTASVWWVWEKDGHLTKLRARTRKLLHKATVRSYYCNACERRSKDWEDKDVCLVRPCIWFSFLSVTMVV